MTSKNSADYYLSHREKLQKDFNKVAKRIAKYLISSYGENFTKIIISETQERFEQILPEIPFIGGTKNQFTIVMIINGWIISFYRSMKAHEKSTEEFIKICCQVADDYMHSLPRFVWKLVGRFACGKLMLRRMVKQAAQSQERVYPEDFVYTVIKGDGKIFDWALEFTECAVNKFYEAQGVEELKPYCNFFDVTYSRYMDVGINANQTIGLGCQTCRLEYKRGRETQIPERLRDVLPNISFS